MLRLIALLSFLASLLGVGFPACAAGKVLAVPEAVLTFANREIVVLRTSVQGASPEQRVKRISERLDRLDEKELAQPLVRSPTEMDHQTGVLFSIAGQSIFVLFEADLDEESRLGLNAAADQVETRLQAAIAATLDQRSGPVLLKGIALSLLATLITAVVLMGIQRLTVFLLARLQKLVQSARNGSRMRWAEHVWLLVQRLAQLLLAFLWVSVAYLWFTFVLSQFPLTQPYADTLSGFLVGLAAVLGRGGDCCIAGADYGCGHSLFDQGSQ